MTAPEKCPQCGAITHDGPLFHEFHEPPMGDCFRLLHQDERDKVCVSEDGKRIAFSTSRGVASMTPGEWADTLYARTLLDSIRAEAIAECEKWRDHHAKDGKADRAKYWSQLAWKWRQGAHPNFANLTGVRFVEETALVARVAELEARLARSVPREVAEQACQMAWGHGRLRFASAGFPEHPVDPKLIWTNGTEEANRGEYREACECASVVLARAEAEAAKPQADKEKSDG